MTNLERIPLLKDHHNHLSFYGLLHDCINLSNVPDKCEALGKLEQLGKESVSVVLGWNSGYYDFTREELSGLPPVIIVNLSLHRFIINPLAEEILEPGNPEIIANYLDLQWFEDHMPMLLTFLANRVKPSLEKFSRFFKSLESLGVYYAEEMLLANDDVFDIVTGSQLRDRTGFWAHTDSFKSLKPSTREGVKGIKLFTDGAVGAKTAAIKRPFKDGKKGYLLYKDKELYEQMAEVAALGKPVSVHAIGERATAQVVNTAAKLKADGIEFPYIRMEHAQFMEEKMAKKAKKLGLILSMQPTFSNDSRIYRDRLDEGYLETNNPFRMLIDKAGFRPGDDLIFGSDGMPHGAYEALNAALFPPRAAQRLTLEEFTAAYGMPDLTHGYLDVKIHDNHVEIASIEIK